MDTPYCPTCWPPPRSEFHDYFAGHEWFHCPDCGVLFTRFVKRGINTLDQSTLHEKGL